MNIYSKTLSEINEIRDECKSMVTTRASLSAGAAVVPIPGMDIGTDIAILLQMIPAINKKFGLDSGQVEELDPQIKKLLLVAASSIGSELIAKLVTKQLIIQVLKKIGIRVAAKTIAKFIPFIGSAASASISFAAMKMVGNSHVDDCFAVAKRVIEQQKIEVAT